MPFCAQARKDTRKDTNFLEERTGVGASALLTKAQARAAPLLQWRIPEFGAAKYLCSLLIPTNEVRLIISHIYTWTAEFFGILI